MSALTQLALPTITGTIDQSFLVEPLQGANRVTSYLDIFPDTLYNKGPNSRLVKLLYTLLGPTGVALVQQDYLKARLIFEEHGLNTTDLESFYGDPFSFGRIVAEMPAFDPSGALSEDAWEAILSQDAMYRNRAIDFLHGVRLGNSPKGMQLVAKSGIGRDVLIVEQYKWLFDQHSDSPLGLVNYGQTDSTEEMVILPNNETSNTQVQTITLDWQQFGPANLLATDGSASNGVWGSVGLYYYVVTAVTAAGESQPYAASGSIPSEAVVNVVATTDNVTLTWDAVPGAISYRVYRSNTSGGWASPNSLVAIVFGQTSLVDTGSITGVGTPAAQSFRLYFNGWYAPQTVYQLSPALTYPPPSPVVPGTPSALTVAFTVDPKALVVATATMNVNTSFPGTSIIGGVTVSNGQYVRLGYQTVSDEDGIWIFNGPTTPMTVAPAIYADSFTMQQYLEALPSIGGGNVSVTGGASVVAGRTVLAPWVVTFTNDLTNNPGLNEIQVISSTYGPDAFSVKASTGIVNADQEIVSIAPADMHALQTAVDRIKAVTTIPTVHPFTSVRQNQPWGTIYATSEQTQVVRFVSGRTDVAWPSTDQFHWIVGGVEQQAPRLASDPQHDYAGFHPVSSVTSSTQHVGRFNKTMSNLYPYLNAETDNTHVFVATDSLAVNPSGASELFITQVALPDTGIPIGMIDGVYPYDYVTTVGGVTYFSNAIKFWASRQHTSESETLLIDFGSVQAINYLDMEIGRKPFNITVQYDIADQPGVFSWQNVTPIPRLSYDDIVSYGFDLLNPWDSIEFNFTDGLNDVVYTRYVLITFTRGLAPAVFGTAGWSCDVRNLRIGRIVGNSTEVPQQLPLPLPSPLGIILSPAAELT
jgi:hypothetical protein